MLERNLIRHAAYFRGWCQAFGEHESIYRDDNGVNWVTAEGQVGLVLPKPLIRSLYREVLLRERVPILTFHHESVEIGSLDIPIGKKYQQMALKAMSEVLAGSGGVHVYLTSHLLYGEGSKIITISKKKPLAIIYKEIGSMRIRLD
jgi:hypothetical protein